VEELRAGGGPRDPVAVVPPVASVGVGSRRVCAVSVGRSRLRYVRSIELAVGYVSTDDQSV
jgi:hypothetical protein